MIRERFAPSPTGFLHLGHAYSAKIGFEAAQESGGEWHLRIEDIDISRCRPEFEAAIAEDLHWLGFHWPQAVVRQSEHFALYDQALEKLRKLGVIYGCACTRRDIALSAPHGVTSHYPGTCRNLGLKGEGLAWRLDAQKACALVGDLSFHEIGQGRDLLQQCDPIAIDDVVLARRDIGTSYHLAVVVDDAALGVTHVTRGDDLEAQTPIHVLLQRLLALPTPIYRHHALVVDAHGKRLAKRDHAREIRQYRAQGLKADEIWQQLRFSADFSRDSK